MLKSVQGVTLLFNVAVKDLTPEPAEKALAMQAASQRLHDLLCSDKGTT